ncbi:hypothetical protein Skr01_65280 [Sphaerisporangium krabiense]|nr:hypothetical protein Skr01_65280 [Sphaerisporangium krabiense]
MIPRGLAATGTTTPPAPISPTATAATSPPLPMCLTVTRMPDRPFGVGNQSDGHPGPGADPVPKSSPPGNRMAVIGPAPRANEPVPEAWRGGGAGRRRGRGVGGG